MSVTLENLILKAFTVLEFAGVRTINIEIVGGSHHDLVHHCVVGSIFLHNGNVKLQNSIGEYVSLIRSCGISEHGRLKSV